MSSSKGRILHSRRRRGRLWFRKRRGKERNMGVSRQGRVKWVKKKWWRRRKRVGGRRRRRGKRVRRGRVKGRVNIRVQRSGRR